jgi:hypothetical protein
MSHDAAQTVIRYLSARNETGFKSILAAKVEGQRAPAPFPARSATRSELGRDDVGFDVILLAAGCTRRVRLPRQGARLIVSES